MIEVAIIDDHKMILNGLMAMLKPAKNIKVVNTFQNPQDLLDSLSVQTPDVLLLDINIPEMNGLEICKRLHRNHPDIKILALTTHNETSFVKNMMRNGAKGYLLKNCSQEELVEGIQSVYEDNVYLDKKIQEQLLSESFGKKENDAFIPKLTRREKEVLHAISEELTNREIGEKLFISVKTVETHRNNLLQKFDVKNTAGLIKAGYIKGFLS